MVSIVNGALGRTERRTRAQENEERRAIQASIDDQSNVVPVIEGAGIKTPSIFENNPDLIFPSPRRTENVPAVSEYTDRVNEEVINRNITPSQVSDIREVGTPIGSITGTQQPVGVDENNQLIYKPVEESTVLEQMRRLELPTGAKEAALDLNYMYDTDPKHSKIHIPANQEERVEKLLTSMYDYTANLMEKNPTFALALGKLTDLDLDQYSKISTLVNSQVLLTQESYVKGRMMGQGSKFLDLIDPSDAPEVSRESQLGMNENEYNRAAIGAFKRILAVGGVDISSLTPEDFTVMAGALLEHAIESNQISSTKIKGEKVYVPRGAHAGSILGNQSNALVGNDLKQNVQDTAPQAGISTQKGRALPGLTGRKSAASSPTDQPTVDLTKDIQSNMPYMVAMKETSIIFLEWMDVIKNLVVPQEGSEQRIHSTSKFAPLFKLDEGTAEASYKRKIYDLSPLGAPSMEQQAKVTRTVNKITNTRITEVYTSLNKQLELIKRGKGDPDGLFFYTFGNSDINGRIYNNTHNGNYTLDKVGARQSQKAKINPYLTIKKEGWEGRNASVNASAIKLLAAEGNPKKFNNIINNMDPDIEAEISFRICLVRTILKDVKHAKKKIGLNEELTPADKNAITLAESSNLLGRSNFSNGELYRAYMRMNSAENPLALIRHFGNQGAAIELALEGANKSVRDLPVIEFDINSSAAELRQQAADAWGDITTNSTEALANYANERGELRQQTSIRDNALSYIKAYDGDKNSPNRFELDFEIELDATQSGPFLQALIAPTASSREVMESLGLEMNTGKGDLRDFAKGLLLDGDVTESAFVGDQEQQQAWQGFVQNIFKSDRASYARELMLKQPIMQFYYGKPASMFSDVSAELLGWFEKEIDMEPNLKGMTPQDRVAGVQKIINSMLTNDRFDANYANVMKRFGKWLALTDSDLVIDGPMGKINLTMESLAQIINDDETIGEQVTPASLRLNIVELFDSQNEETIQFQTMRKSRTTASPKTKSQYDPTLPTSGTNIRTNPGKKLSDALGVLIIHQLDNAVMNHTVNIVNMDRPRNNPLPAKIIYDAIIPNAAGYLRYHHAYNNESLPLAQKWDLPKSLKKLSNKARVKFNKDIEGIESFNISVIEGRDGHLHGVERFAVLTGWLDEYSIRQPRRQDYPSGKDGLQSFQVANAKSKDQVTEEAMMSAVNSGYKRPILAESFYEQGFINQGEAFVINAEERSNMYMSKKAFISLLVSYQNKFNSSFDDWVNTVYDNKVPINTGMGHLG